MLLTCWSAAEHEIFNLMKQSARTDCYCGSGMAYADCCRPLHQGAAAANAESLMRSRYSAYVLKLEAYLLASWHPATRPQRLNLDNDADGASTIWLGLEIKRHIVTGPDSASVEFVARCRLAGRGQRMHEISRFVRENGHWFYVDAEK